MRRVLNIWFMCFVAFVLFGCSTERESEKLPNVIYILADDLGYGDVTCYNPDSKISTPNIDQLANQGMMFTDAHSPSSVCTPTRYGILTGDYCWRSPLKKGVLWGYGRALIEKEKETVATLLKKNGYTTGVIGKWHLGIDWPVKKQFQHVLDSLSSNKVVKDMNSEYIDFSKPISDGPLNHGFDYSYILPASLDMEPYCYIENDMLMELLTDSTPGNDLNTGYAGAFWRPGKKSPGFDFYDVLPGFTRKANDFIESNADKDKPFFLYLPLAAPHTPWVPKDEFLGESDAGLYGDFVTMVDEHVGNVIQKLKKEGLDENTLVIFTSDNGPFWRPEMIEKFNHRAMDQYRGMKADIWEGGHRIPFIARWPGKIKPGTTSDVTTTLTNLFATLADILNVNSPAGVGVDSYSVLPVLLGTSDSIENQPAVIHHSSMGHFAIRKGDWKYIEKRGSGGFTEPKEYEPKQNEPGGQLYNLKNDPTESNNVHDEFPEKVKELQMQLDMIRRNPE